MASHFYPYQQHEHDDPIENVSCGVWLGENPSLARNWDSVTCGRCLRSRARIEAQYAAEEEEIVRQMGAWAEFMKQEQQP